MILTKEVLCNNLVDILMDTIPDTRLSTDKDKEKPEKGIFAGMEYLGLEEEFKTPFVKSTDSTKYKALANVILENESYQPISLVEGYESQMMNIFRDNVELLLHYTQHNTSMKESLNENMEDLKEGFNPDLVKQYSELINGINEDYDALISRVTKVVEVLYACDPSFSLFRKWNVQNNSGELDYHLREELETRFKDVKLSLMGGEL
jgi:hypothetical protein